MIELSCLFTIPWTECEEQISVVGCSSSCYYKFKSVWYITKVRISQQPTKGAVKSADWPTYSWACTRLQNPSLFVEQRVTLFFVQTSRGTSAGRSNGRCGTLTTRINNFYESRDLEAAMEVDKGYMQSILTMVYNTQRITGFLASVHRREF
jgi:hypothetical protein